MTDRGPSSQGEPPRSHAPYDTSLTKLDSHDTKTVLLTGSAGFIGCQLCEKLLRARHHVIDYDAVTDYDDVNLKHRRTAFLSQNDTFGFHRARLENEAPLKANEAMSHSYAHSYGIPTTCFRFFTVYSPRGRPDMALFKFTKAILAGEPIDTYNHGYMRRDFTYVEDLAEAVRLLVVTVPSEAPVRSGQSLA